MTNTVGEIPAAERNHRRQQIVAFPIEKLLNPRMLTVRLA